MLIITTMLKKLRYSVKQWHQKNKSIALIPTMGNLHKGHIKLIEAGSLYADKVIVSSFINPIQFESSEDLIAYPCTLQEDCEKLIKSEVDILFVPTVRLIYPSGVDKQTFVDVPCLSSILEGASRPGHFIGVAIIISKIFNLINPDIACFGEKDFQQLAIIRKIVHDMSYDIKIISVPTVRDKNGLALSSRNSNLTVKGIHLAPQLHITLKRLVEQLCTGEWHANTLIESAAEQLLHIGIQPDQLDIRDAYDLQSLTINSCKIVVLFSAWLEKTRLIDNNQFYIA